MKAGTWAGAGRRQVPLREEMDVNLLSERGTLSGEVSAIGITSSSLNVLSHLREIIPALHPSPPRRIQSL